ncbi:PAS domain-containing protein [Novosphingobium sp. PC22D]|uniref:PAS domain-containing protein n=1 Tax=Novosphingobium sp. PC22D TaxID=1962403 RepID=UPI000BEFC192|nr:PAS domain-containing protein [Novosphingobium sp. PC22D]
MIKNSPIAALIADPHSEDTPIIACNDAFLELTGYEREEVIGRNCRFLAGPDTEPWQSQRMRIAIRERRPVQVELLNYRKDGSTFRNAVLIAPIFDADGRIEWFLGSQVEVPEDGRDGEANGHRVQSARTRFAAASPRQREILVKMAEGKLNKQIAFELGLSERTIKMHRSALFRALGVRTAAEAIRIAIEAGH